MHLLNYSVGYMVGCENNVSNYVNCSMNINASQPIPPPRKGPEIYLLPLLFSIIFVVGVVGNSTLIWIVLRNKSMRNVPNIYIVSLAIGDLMLLLVSVPFTATIYTFIEWPYGETVCKINEFLQSVSLGISVFTLTALSGDRYTAIVNPIAKRSESGLSHTLGVSSMIWIFSILLALPDAISSHVYKNIRPGHRLVFCSLYPESWPGWYPQFHITVRFLIYFAIPVTVIALFYVLMAAALMKSSKTSILTDSKQQDTLRKQLKARKKVAVLVLGFVLIFVICWLPRHIYAFWFHYDPGWYNLFWHVFKIVGFCLSFVNSCINPVTLYFLSKQFRKYYDMYLLCCIGRTCSKRQDSNFHLSSSSSTYKDRPSKNSYKTSMTRLSSYKRPDKAHIIANPHAELGVPV